MPRPFEIPEGATPFHSRVLHLEHATGTLRYYDRTPQGLGISVNMSFSSDSPLPIVGVGATREAAEKSLRLALMGHPLTIPWASLV